MKLKNIYFFVTLLLIIILVLSCSTQQTQYANLILTNGKIIAVNKQYTIGKAIAIKSDTIIALGTHTELKKYFTKKTKKETFAKKSNAISS